MPITQFTPESGKRASTELLILIIILQILLKIPCVYIFFEIPNHEYGVIARVI